MQRSAVVRRGAKQRRAEERKNARKGVQPMRFMVRRPDDFPAMCVAASSAAELFAPYVCLSSHEFDATVFTLSDAQKMLYPEETLGEIKEIEMWDVENKGDRIQFLNTSTKTTDGELVVRWKPSTENAAQECKHRFQAFKIGEAAHIVIWLFDRKRFTMEIFDSAGEKMKRRFVHKVLDIIFGKDKPRPSWRFVNNRQLQEDPTDIYCQTYIYYYLYQRLLVGEPAYRILQNLQKMDPKERINHVQQFWRYLIHS